MASIVREEYRELVRRNELRNHFVRTNPFEHAILPNFFTDEFIARVKEQGAALSLEASPPYGEAARATMAWGAYRDPTTLTQVFGSELRAVLSSLLGRTVIMSARSIPQYFRYEPGSAGMSIHNDDKEENGREIVSLLQLSEGYRPGLGGELRLHGGPEENFSVAASIAPVENTFVVFLVSPHSWHSVADMQGEWIRKLVSFDWYFQ